MDNAEIYADVAVMISEGFIQNIFTPIEAVVEKTGEGFRVIKAVQAPDGGIRLVLEAE